MNRFTETFTMKYTCTFVYSVLYAQAHKKKLLWREQKPIICIKSSNVMQPTTSLSSLISCIWLLIFCNAELRRISLPYSLNDPCFLQMLWNFWLVKMIRQRKAEILMCVCVCVCACVCACVRACVLGKDWTLFEFLLHSCSSEKKSPVEQRWFPAYL